MANNENKTEEIQIDGTLTLSAETRLQIKAKIAELKKSLKARIYAIVVEGDEEEGEKPFYIAYFRRPGLQTFSQYMTFVQKDVTIASKNLAAQCIVDGDRELVDNEDLFLYGLMPKLSVLIEARNGEMVK